MRRSRGRDRVDDIPAVRRRAGNYDHLIAAPMPLCREECLRHVSPVQLTEPRWASRDVRFAGQDFRLGDSVAALLTGASRDPGELENPHQFGIGLPHSFFPNRESHPAWGKPHERSRRAPSTGHEEPRTRTARSHGLRSARLGFEQALSTFFVQELRVCMRCTKR
jgi:hypothetical protein